jgi:hypothetical protein
MSPTRNGLRHPDLQSLCQSEINDDQSGLVDDAEAKFRSVCAQLQLDELAAQGGAEEDKTWNRMIEHCEQFTEELFSSSLLIHAALVKQYDHVGSTTSKGKATDDPAEMAIWHFLRSQVQKSEDVLEAYTRLAKDVKKKGGRDGSANRIFSQIEFEALSTFGFDDLRTITLLENIGQFYQDEESWQEAAPRFEQALAASLSRYCTRHPSVSRLEATLENKHYEIDVTSDDDHTDCHQECRGSSGRMSKLLVLGCGGLTKCKIGDLTSD